MNNSKTAEHYRIVQSLRDLIAQNDLIGITNILETQSDPNFYNEDLESAASLAITLQNDDVYDLLLLHGVCLGPHEKMEKLVMDFPMEIKSKIRTIHKKHFKEASLKHLQSLNNKSKLSPGASDTDRQSYQSLITKAFDDLNSLESVEPILKVASTGADLQIVFDFNHGSVDNLDPSKDPNVRGTTYPSEHLIYIGAKNISEDSGVLGTLAHELCHYAMELLYHNNCKPYRESEKNRRDFDGIVSACETNRDWEDLINTVYDVPPDKMHAELIVRVPHLAAVYMYDESKFSAMRENFRELFNFYGEKVLVDLKREYPLLEARKELFDACEAQATWKNTEIELSPIGLSIIDIKACDKVSHIASNCPQITMRAIFQKFSNSGSYIFASLKVILNEENFQLAWKALQLCSEPILIVDCHRSQTSDAVSRAKF